MKKLSVIFLVVLLAGCSSMQITYDYDKEADFSKYKTYAYDDETMKMPVSQLDRDRILKAIDNEMIKEGFTKSEESDVVINVLLKTKTQVQATANTSGGYGYGRYGWGGGFSTTQINYDEYTDGTLFISMIDIAQKQLVWQGRATKTIDETTSADKKDANITYGMEQVFKNYPPPQ